MQLGDLTSEAFAQDALTERRGLRWTSRHRPLRQPSAGPGLLQLDQPSRLRVLNEDGLALYATGLLPSGQYRLDGLSAPSLPGFLQLELESLSGQRQTVLLPWVTSPLLLNQGDRLFDLELYPQGAAAAQTLWGLTGRRRWQQSSPMSPAPGLQQAAPRKACRLGILRRVFL